MLYYRVQDPMVEMPEKDADPEEINRQVLRALRATGVVNAREDVVEGLDGGLCGRSDVVPLERKKDGSFSARSSVLEEADFKTVSAFVDKKIRQAGGTSRSARHGRCECARGCGRGIRRRALRQVRRSSSGTKKGLKIF